MKATLDTKNSWEKAQWWKLENGFTVIINHGFYGEYITKIFPTGSKIMDGWQACNGKEGLYEWAKPWIKPIAPGHWETLVRPEFEKVYA